MTWEQAVQWLRDQPDQSELVKACFFDDPLLDAAQRFHASDEWQGVRKFLGDASGRALDIGAGRGISSYALARDGWETTALEPDPSQLVGNGAIRALGEQSGMAIKVVQEWGEGLPFEDASFNLVHCRQVLHHARDLGALCREAARVLKPGGQFIATREHVISKPEDLPAFLQSHPLEHLYGGEHAYLLEEYLGAIENAGLRISHCLNPYENEINRYPASMADIKRALLRRVLGRLAKLVPAGVIPDALVVWWGGRINAPGRLYTFVASKPEDAK